MEKSEKQSSDMDWIGNFASDILTGKKKIFHKEVKKQAVSGAIYIPRGYIGKKCIVIISTD